MIVSTVACPHCGKAEPVIKQGRTECGTGYPLGGAKCKDCNKSFAINPKSNAVTPEKEAAVLRLLEERITIRGIYRAVKCGPQTVYATLKKSGSTPRV